jgi:DNA-binding beta-propeller fold protein YncE
MRDCSIEGAAEGSGRRAGWVEPCERARSCDRVLASGAARRRPRAFRRLIVACGMLIGALLLWSGPALALSQRGHEFNFSFEGAFATPSGVAVNESLAEDNVYVADEGNERIDRFTCSGTSCTPLAPFKVPGEPRSIAVDNNPASPSFGDIYVATEEAAYKYNLSDPTKPAVFKTFKAPEEEKEELGEIHGIAVDKEGNLYVYRVESIVKFDNSNPHSKKEIEEGKLKPATKNKVVENLELFLNCEARPGFAVAPNGEALYIGHELETRNGECEEPKPAVIAKLDSSGEMVNGALDRESTTAAAVDLSNGDVYLDNVSTVAAFDPSGALIQRFGSGHLTQGAGMAIDAKTGEVYVADSKENKVDVFKLEEPGPPSVDSESAQNVTPTSERLSAQIDPKGAETHYFFQYGTVNCETSPSSCAEVPSGGAQIAAGFGDVEVSRELSGLQPGTDYFFRVIAENVHGKAEGAIRTFTTLPSSLETLADNRAWELVTPPEKNGIGIEAITIRGGLIQASEDGHAITYWAAGPIGPNPEGNRAFEVSQILSTRGIDAWSSQDIQTPTEKGEGLAVGGLQEYQAFTPDLSFSYVAPQPGQELEPTEHPPLSEEATERTIYRRNNFSCQPPPSTCYTPLVTGANNTANTQFGGKLTLVGASPDLNHAVIDSKVALTTTPLAPEQPGLYEWGSGAALQLVSELPAPGEISCGGSSCKPAWGPALGDSNFNVRNAVSDSGSRVFWTASTGQAEEDERLYMRDTATAETIQIDAAQGVVEPPAGVEDEYQTASSDGSRVFFTSPNPLNTESSLGEEAVEHEEGRDLYVCELGVAAKQCNLQDLTVGRPGESADVQGVLGASTGGSVVYFVANGVLGEGAAEGAAPGNCGGGDPGATCSLYEDHYNPAAKKWDAPTFIATLSGKDSPVWKSQGVHNQLTFVTSRVSPSGQFVAFMSERPLTGYDNRDTHAEAHEARDEEVFLYDSTSKRLKCASCNPSGARPAGVLDTPRAGEGYGLLVDRPAVWVGRWLAASIPGWSGPNEPFGRYQSRYLSDDGRLFFNAADALVPQDKNERLEEVNSETKATEMVGVEDVYEYEPAGVGGCEKEGCVSLISSGKSAQESAFLDASGRPGQEGDDAFFVTTQQLVAADQDPFSDVYDARVCTESAPCLRSEVSSQRPCEETDRCRPPGPSQQVFGAPTSATFSGPGNSMSVETRGSKASTPAHRVTRAEHLAKALKACRKKYKGKSKAKKHKRAVCERQAKKKYGAKKPAKHSKKATRR